MRVLFITTAICATLVFPCEPAAQQSPALERAEAVCQALIEWGGPRLNPNTDEAFSTCVDLSLRAREYGFEPPVWDRLVVALAYQETGMTPDASGPVGELGVMQVHPDYAADPDDPVASALLALAARRSQAEDQPAPITHTLCRYNGGEVCVDAAYDYAADVRSVMTRIRELLP